MRITSARRNDIRYSAAQDQRVFRVGVRLQEWSEGLAYRIIPGISQFLGEGADWDIYYDHRSCGELARRSIDQSWDGDGLLVFRYTKDEAIAWRKNNVRVVNLSFEYPEDAPFPRVTLDNRQVAQVAVEHLAGLGLRDLAYWHDPQRGYSAERLEAFAQEARDAGCRVYPLVVHGDRMRKAASSREPEPSAAAQLLSLPKPAGVFAKDDVAAQGILRLCAALGIRCPEDLAVLGLSDDAPLCELTSPTLSSIRFPGRRLGYAAATLLHALMCGKPSNCSHHEQIAPGPVITRQSSRRVEFGDPIVGPALAIIARETAHRSVSVTDVCQEMGVSREELRSRMRALIGRTPKQEIDRARLAALEARLLANDAPLEVIAEAMGFYGADDLSRFFRRMRNHTPGQFRADRRER
jgi:LacI family transcriptional regulator